MPDDDAPLTGAELRDYLQSRDDFAFERRMFRHADGFRLEVHHAGLYEDSTLGKQRQFDLRAVKRNGDHHIRLAIECKSLRSSYPLVVSCVPRPENEAYHEVMLERTEHGDRVQVRRLQSRLYAQGDPVGKAMRQVGRQKGKPTGGDDMFDKYQQAMASAAGLVDGAAQYHRVCKPRQEFTGILPLLVIPDGTLWVAKYSTGGDFRLNPEAADSIAFYLGRQYVVRSVSTVFTISQLHVMTETAAVDLLRQLGEPRPGGIWELLFLGLGYSRRGT